MAKYDQIPDEVDQFNPATYEPVTYCRDKQQAEQLRDLLIDHDIAAVVPDDEQERWVSVDEGVAVFVPIDLADEARDILEEIELIEEMDIADPDFEGPTDDDEQVVADMQPLGTDAYYLEGDDDAPDLLESEDGF